MFSVAMKHQISNLCWELNEMLIPPSTQWGFSNWFFWLYPLSKIDRPYELQLIKCSLGFDSLS